MLRPVRAAVLSCFSFQFQTSPLRSASKCLIANHFGSGPQPLQIHTGLQAMAPKMKILYFDHARARVEIMRLVLNFAKVPYEEKLVPKIEDWEALKPTTLFGILPEVEMDGKRYIQGMAIATYLAREHGLYGSDTPMEGLIIDQIQQVREDMLTQEIKAVVTKPEEERAKAQKHLDENVIPKTLKYFTDAIEDNPARSGLVLGEKLTLADIVIFEAVESLVLKNANALDLYPEIKALRQIVAEVDGIKEYIAKRKVTPI